MQVEVLSTKDVLQWKRYCGSEMVFALPEYVILKERETGAEGLLIAISDGSGSIVCPMLKRSIDTMGDDLWDSTTPEFTGPYIVGAPEDRRSLVVSFRRVMRELLDERGVSQFAHLHPWRTVTECLVADDIFPDRQIVFVDLEPSLDEIWSKSYNHACRKNIGKAEREGVKVFAASSDSHIKEFARIYRLTMDRNKAAEAYYHADSYFEWFRESLPGNSVFLLAEYKDRVVAGTLYLYDTSYMYSYLGGADEEFQQVRPTNAVVHTAVQIARERGLRALVLGGGYKPGDGIFRFKSTFSPNTVTFHTYRHVHDRRLYDHICRQSGVPTDLPTTGYFPAYRGAY